MLISEIRDLKQGTSSFLRSNLPIDVEFKSLVQEISSFDDDVELLYDSRDHPGTSAA